MMDIGGCFYYCFSSFETQRAHKQVAAGRLFHISKASGVYLWERLPSKDAWNGLILHGGMVK